MTKNQLKKMDIADRNLELIKEFNLYVLEHPEITEQLPEEATIILLPQDDPELCEVNKRIAKKRIQEGDTVVYVKIEEIRWQFKKLSFNTPSQQASVV